MPGMPLLRRHHARPGAGGAEAGTPFSLNIVALAMYLRFVHAVSYQRLSYAGIWVIAG